MPTVKAEDILQQSLKNEEFRKVYDEEGVKLDAALALLHAREASGLSQRQLAEMAAVPQSTIARIEAGSNTSLETLAKLGRAMGKKVKVSFD